ncbi:hypothetical protein EW146_g8624 [Bondarzewia mesenterica]|uniref:Uncharacterized protein n=1 Tax=Bondarzewia mesenterica TaxID=1095465 RepID=A0A4V6S1A0_9AGAM|nr:hypothetical protein EW146_g8624 [Bondarzewia mesenterica]
MSSTLTVRLSPSPAFCIKSTSLQPGVFNVSSSSSSKDSLDAPSRRSIPIPKGFKVFVNIAWDKNVPPPPEGSEDAIQRAMLGQDVDELNTDGWFVPVIVSDGREDRDKCELYRLYTDAYAVTNHHSLRTIGNQRI